MAVNHSVDGARWLELLDELMGCVAARFGRVETRRTAREFVAGLLSELPIKNCWTLAEHVGHRTPDAMQNLLARASWDEKGAGDDLRGFVTGHLGDAGAVLVVDETGDLKSGIHTVGVQRQYTGTAGRIENAQVAVYLTYATDAGHTFLDRELYLPKSWTEDRERCEEAGVPATVGFATKPALATAMITRALDGGVNAAWVAGDEVYGADPGLRHILERRGVGYVLAIGCDRRVDTRAGRYRADELAATVPKRAWQRLSAGDGAKGPRFYDWAWIDIEPDHPSPGHRWLLVRRNNSTGELAYYRCYSPKPVPLRTLVGVAGRRWTVEENFKTGKGLVGLDKHQVRTWCSWRRWTMLAMLAHAFLVALAVTERAAQPTPDDLISLTCNEIRHLFTVLIIKPTHDLAHRLRCSTWRRRHQHRAKTCHYQRRSAEQT